MPSTLAAPAASRSSGRVRALVAELVGRPAYRLLFGVTLVSVTAGYTLLLPFEFTQRLGLGNWRYLTPRLAGFSIALGLGLAVLVTLQVYAARRAVAGRGNALGGVALLASIIPSLICCSPLIPTLLATVGMSALGVAATAGTIQYFVAVHQTEILTASVMLLTATAGWSARSVARAACRTDAGCPTPPETQ